MIDIIFKIINTFSFIAPFNFFLDIPNESSFSNFFILF